MLTASDYTVAAVGGTIFRCDIISLVPDEFISSLRDIGVGRNAVGGGSSPDPAIVACAQGPFSFQVGIGGFSSFATSVAVLAHKNPLLLKFCGAGANGTAITHNHSVKVFLREEGQWGQDDDDPKKMPAGRGLPARNAQHRFFVPWRVLKKKSITRRSPAEDLSRLASVFYQHTAPNRTKR